VNTYTTSAAFLEALPEAGVNYVFANFGSDHPAWPMDACARARAEDGAGRFPN
jgi:acetolactate synthase-1/2/3 large subunit